MLRISFLLFLAFFANVFWAALGNPSLMTGVQELILLSISVLFFVIAILQKEAGREGAGKNNQ